MRRAAQGVNHAATIQGRDREPIHKILGSPVPERARGDVRPWPSRGREKAGCAGRDGGAARLAPWGMQDGTAQGGTGAFGHRRPCRVPLSAMTWVMRLPSAEPRLRAAGFAREWRMRNRRHRSGREKLVKRPKSGDLAVTQQAAWGMPAKMERRRASFREPSVYA